MNGKRPQKRPDQGYQERLPMKRGQGGEPAGKGRNPQPAKDGEYLVPEEVSAAETIIDGLLPGEPEVSDDDIFLSEAPKKPAKAPAPAKLPGGPAKIPAKKPSGGIQAAPGKPRPPTTRPSAEAVRPAAAAAKPGAAPAAAKKPSAPQPAAGGAAKKTSTRRVVVQSQAAAAKPKAPAAAGGEAPPKSGTEEISPKEMARRMQKIEGGEAPLPKTSSERRARKTETDEDDVLEPVPRSKPSARAGGTRKKSRLGMADFAFRGSGLWLGLMTYPRDLMVLLGAACLAFGAAGFLRSRPDLAGRIPQFKPEWLNQLFGKIPFDFSTVPLWPWAAAAPALVFILLAALLTAKARSYRLRSTFIFRSQLVDGRSAVNRLKSRVLRFFLALATGGLAWPWLHAADVRRDWEMCSLKRRDDEVGFDGTGFQALWLCILTFVMSPLILLSLGILAPLAWIRWIDWEQGHITVKTPGGSEARPEFTGSTGSLVGKHVAWSLLTLLTAFLCRPFAAADVWTWIADNTSIEEPAESEPDPGEDAAGEDPE